MRRSCQCPNVLKSSRKQNCLHSQLRTQNLVFVLWLAKVRHSILRSFHWWLCPIKCTPWPFWYLGLSDFNLVEQRKRLAFNVTLRITQRFVIETKHISQKISKQRKQATTTSLKRSICFKPKVKTKSKNHRHHPATHACTHTHIHP